MAGERGHDVTLLEAMPWAGGQIRLAARNPRRRDLLGIVEWRVSELARLGVDVRYDVLAEGADVAALDPDVVIVATGGLPQLPDIDEGAERMVTSWDVLGGDVKPAGEVLLFDDNGTHSALSAAEMIARSGARLEIVTPERMLGIDIGGMNHVPYARAFNETDTRITLNQRVLAVRPEQGRLCVEIGSDHSPHLSVRHVDWVVADHGTAATADLYFELKPSSTNLGAVDYGALLEGRPQSLTQEPGRPVPAVPHRRRRRQPQHPRRGLRRPAAGQGPLATRVFRAIGVFPRTSPGQNTSVTSNTRMELAFEARDAGLQRAGEAAALAGRQQVDDEAGEHRLDERGLERRLLGIHALGDEALLDVRPPRRDLVGPHRRRAARSPWRRARPPRCRGGRRRGWPPRR